MNKTKTKTKKKTTGKSITLASIDSEVSKKVNYKFDLVIVDSKNSLTEAQKNLKSVKATKKDYKDRLEPFKQFLDGWHKKVTTAENTGSEIYDAFAEKQQDEIDDYKEKVFEEQQKKIRAAEKLAELKAEEERKELEAQAKKEAAKLEREAKALEKKGATKKSIKEKRAEASEIKEHSKNIEVEPEEIKVVLEKDKIKQNSVYSKWVNRAR